MEMVTSLVSIKNPVNFFLQQKSAPRQKHVTDKKKNV